MKASHTDKQGRAKCLAYRNGKRCGRVARVIGSYADSQGEHEQSLCIECAQAKAAHRIQASRLGFTVHTSNIGGWADRTYRAIT